MDSRERAIRELQRQQHADDVPAQRPQRFGAGGLEPVLSLQRIGLDDIDPDLEGSYRATGTGADAHGSGVAYDEAVGPARLGRFVPRDLEALSAHEARGAESTQEEIVRAAVEGMTDAQRETFHLVYGEGLSMRDAAARLGITAPAIHSRVQTIKAIIARALVAAATGSEPS